MSVKNASRKVQVACYVEPEMQAWLTARAEARGETLSTVLATLLVDARRGEEQPERALAEQLAVHLDRMHRAVRDATQRMREDHQFLEEILASFVRVYLNHAPVPPDHMTRELSRMGGERFEKFCSCLVDNYGRHSLLTGVRTSLRQAKTKEDGPEAKTENGHDQ